MILKRANIKNFRALRDATVDFSQHTAILGGNGAGKSTVLKAIEKFYSKTSSIELDDFFGRKASNPIEIALTFTGFSGDERDRFGDRIQNGEMTVTRVFEDGSSRSNGRYYGATLQHPMFFDIRNANGANPQRTLFRQFIQDNPDYGFEAVGAANQIEPQLAAWEENNPDQCELMRDDGQFFGFSNVGRGNLEKSTSFVFIPAVRDASEDALDSRGAVVSRLMELVVRSAIQKRKEVKDFQSRISEEYKDLVDPEKLTELAGLEGALTETLQKFYEDTGVELQWRSPDEFAVPLPSADVRLQEEGFPGPVDRKGHGLQRAFILTLLQHLAKATSAEAATEPETHEASETETTVGEAEVTEPETTVDAMTDSYVLPGLILAIEEPELYQHPTKQRHFANVLSQLSDGSLPGVATQTQVLFASHSSLFVSMTRFDEIRIARRYNSGEETKECRFTKSSIQRVVQKLELISDVPPGTYSADALKSRLHIFGPEMAEGFFADLAVIVEGVSDKAALVAIARAMGVDFEARGIAILVANGKSKIDKPASIFSDLSIPIFSIWDNDSSKAQAQRDEDSNHRLYRLGGHNGDFGCHTLVSETFACFEDTVEAQLRRDLTDQVFQECREIARSHYDLKYAKDVLKTPMAMEMMINEAKNRGHWSFTLGSIVQAIIDAKNRARDA